MVNQIKPLKPWHNENFGRSYGCLVFEGKIVLDIGADYGSTANFFLSKGATRVIAVESYPPDAAALEEYAEGEPRIIAITKHINCSEDFKEILQRHKVDLAKIDCEGCEFYLLGLENFFFSSIPEYFIELHNLANARRCNNPRRGPNDLRDLFAKKLERNGFDFEIFYQKRNMKWMVWAKRRV